MHEQPTHLATFAGIGGFSLAAAACGFFTVAHSEIDPDADAAYAAFFPESINLGDITRIDWREFRRTHGVPLVASGGIPCQPASLLGKMRGVDDERWLWPEAIRMGRELGCPFLEFENPPSILSLDDGRAFNRIMAEFATLGYDGWWDVFPAAAFGAGHLRERLLIILAHRDRSRWRAGGGRGDLLAIAKGRPNKHTKWLPTPRASASEARQTKLTPSQKERMEDGSAGHGMSLQAAVMAHFIPTPTARDYKDTPGMKRVTEGDREGPGVPLPRYIFANDSSAKIGGMRLAPAFLCWLMGYPENWWKPIADALATRLSRTSSSPISKRSKKSSKPLADQAEL